MTMGIRALVAALVLVNAAAARADVGDEPPGPDVPGAIVRTPKPRPCELETRLRGRQKRDGVMLEASMRNRSNARIEVTLVNACPNGAAELLGLPKGYDAYSACNRGACVDMSPRRVIVPSGAERVIATTTIHPRGDACNAPLPEGVYMIGAQPRFVQVTAETCGAAPYRLVVGKGPETPPGPMPPESMPPEPTKKVAPPPEPTKKVAPPPGTRPIPCGLACPNGVLDSIHCTCKKLQPMLSPPRN
jgi:hypothetical protein